MTKEQFKHIWQTKVYTNGPWQDAAVEPRTARRYRNNLLKYDKEILEKAVDKLLIDEMANLPPVGEFVEYCEVVNRKFKHDKTTCLNVLEIDLHFECIELEKYLILSKKLEKVTTLSELEEWKKAYQE